MSSERSEMYYTLGVHSRLNNKQFKITMKPEQHKYCIYGISPASVNQLLPQCFFHSLLDRTTTSAAVVWLSQTNRTPSSMLVNNMQLYMHLNTTF